MPATLLTCSEPSTASSPMCLSSSAMASLSSNTVGRSSESSFESIRSLRSNWRAPNGRLSESRPCRLTAARRQTAASAARCCLARSAACVPTILPWPPMRDFTMPRMWSGAWLPDRSSVSRLMTEHGSAGNVMFTLMRSCCPREVSTKRWSLFFTRIKSTNSTQTSSAISTVHVMETIAPVSVRLRNSCKVFGKTSNEEKRTMRAGARRGGVGA